MTDLSPGAALKKIRSDRDWSQSKLAEELGLRSKGYICDIERGGGLSRPLAIAVYRRFEVKLPPIDALSEDEIDMLERVLALRGRAS